MDFSQNMESTKYPELLDNNTESCMDTSEAFGVLDHYVIWLQLSQWLGHFEAAVTFKSPLRCVDRQVLFKLRVPCILTIVIYNLVLHVLASDITSCVGFLQKVRTPLGCTATRSTEYECFACSALRNFDYKTVQ